MDALKAKLTGLGLSEDMADKAIATVGDFIKERIPENFRPMVDKVLSGEDVSGDAMGGAKDLLGGFFK